MREGSPIRTFLAIELPEELRRRLGSVSLELSGHDSILKWVRADLIHITVRFLGNVPADRLPAVEEAARKSAAGVEPFTLHLDGLGAFPREQMPRVIWAGLRRGHGLEALQRLHERVENELARRGFQREDRPFSPHVTLARAREEASSSDRRKLGEAFAQVRATSDVTGSFEVRELVVMKSELNRSGPTYTPLAIVQLGENR